MGLPWQTVKAEGASEVTEDEGQRTEVQQAREYWKTHKLSAQELIELDAMMKDKNKYRSTLSELNKKEITNSTEEQKLSKSFRLIRECVVNESDTIGFQRGSHTKQTHVTWKAVGIVGIELYRYTLYGSFWYDSKVSKVTNAEATGSTSYPGWSKTASSAKAIGATATGIWSFVYYVGVAPIGMSLRTVDQGANLYCDKKGKIYSRTW
jgi:hypothetical protein